MGGDIHFKLWSDLGKEIIGYPFVNCVLDEK
jgi:hypothetical protein